MRTLKQLRESRGLVECLTDESNFHRALITHNPKNKKWKVWEKGAILRYVDWERNIHHLGVKKPPDSSRYLLVGMRWPCRIGYSPCAFIKSFEDWLNQSSFLKNLGKMQHVQERPKETRKGD